jgi:p-aminobenzoyl-glutamate transporter AbgT
MTYFLILLTAWGLNEVANYVLRHKIQPKLRHDENKKRNF